MSTIISESEKDKLYTQVFHLLGMPVRGIELTQEQMDTFLELSISEYEQYVSDWLIESQWSALAGLNLDTQSLSRAFTTRSLDYETQYTHSYSKIVGLQAGGDNELKKDFIELTHGQQIYEVPAGREINELFGYMNEFNLSDRIIPQMESRFDFIMAENVREFIRLLKEELCFRNSVLDDEQEHWVGKKIDKLAGQRLIE